MSACCFRDKKLSSDSDVYEKTDDSDEEQDEADAADVAAGIRSASDVDVLPVRHAVMLKGIQDADMNVVHPGTKRVCLSVHVSLLLVVVSGMQLTIA